MKICKTSTGNRRLTGIVCLLLASGVMTAATAEEATPAYTMSAIEDAAYGAAILAGNYTTAIEGIAKPALERYLALALSNRGVYLAVSGSTAAANDDFNAAVSLSARLDAPTINLERLARQVQPAA